MVANFCDVWNSRGAGSTLLPLHFAPKDFVGISDLTQGETGTQDATGTLSVDPLKP